MCAESRTSVGVKPISLRRAWTRRAKSRIIPSPSSVSSRCPLIWTVMSSSTAVTQFSPVVGSLVNKLVHSAHLKLVISRNRDSTFCKALSDFFWSDDDHGSQWPAAFEFGGLPSGVDEAYDFEERIEVCLHLRVP